VAVGRVGLVTVLDGESICSNFMQLMRPNTLRVMPEYLHLYLNALHASGGTEHMQRASTNIRNIKASEYLQLMVPLPSLERQKFWVDQADVHRGSIHRLRDNVDVVVSHGTALERALLSAAFSGRLTGRASDIDVVEELAGV
jgi:type I restriction enzyme, S subunit